MTKPIAVIFTLILSATAYGSVRDLGKVKARWKAAVFKGLVVGKATKADVLKTMGKPSYVGKWEDSRSKEPDYYQFYVGDGTFEVTITKGILQNVQLEGVSLKTMEESLGKNYVDIYYAICPTIDEGGDSSPMYAAKKGDILLRYYPERGVYVWTVESSGLSTLIYAAEPILTTRCPPKKSASRH